MLNSILNLFKSPSAFVDDPVNWAYSQIGHGYLGCAFTTIITWALLKMTGDYPNDALIAVMVVAAYLIWWELDIQGWKGWDTLEDTLFVGTGAGLFVIIDMSEVIDRLAGWVLITGLALFIGVVRRV